MKQIYKKIWVIAKLYYNKGRPMDIAHVRWMMREALIICKKENIDESLLLPLVILHDCGYAKSKKDNPYKLSLRAEHMRKGAVIAQRILNKLNYPKNKTKKIVKWISAHDNWALGNNDVYKKDKVLSVFNDLDFIWMATPIGFREVSKILKKNKEEMLEYLKNNEKLRNRPFATLAAKALFHSLLKERDVSEK